LPIEETDLIFQEILHAMTPAKTKFEIAITFEDIVQFSSYLA